MIDYVFLLKKEKKMRTRKKPGNAQYAAIYEKVKQIIDTYYISA
jgi:hypothetical protein